MRQILLATATAQAEATPADIVFDSFELAKEASAVPSLSHWIEADAVESIGKLVNGQHTYERTVTIVVIVLARTLEALDDLCEEVEFGLSNAELGLRTLFTGTAFVENTEGERHYYGARLAYSVVYTTASNQPSLSQQPLGNNPTV